MPENDYTGSSTEDAITLEQMLLEDGFYEVALEEDGDIPVDDDDEILFNVADTINGATSLVEISSRLYDLADELIGLSEDGWEIVDDVIEGQATIVHFAAVDSAE